MPALSVRPARGCDEHRERVGTGCGIDAGVPRLLENESLKSGDQEARHRVVVETIWKLAAGSGLPDHAGQHRARRVNALTHRDREAAIMEALGPERHGQPLPSTCLGGGPTTHAML